MLTIPSSRTMHPHRPTSRQLAHAFRERTGCPPPPASRIYRCDASSPVNAVPEFAPMGGVLLSYPGPLAYLPTQIQLPATGPRAFGVPNELIVRMQQADSARPLHVFVFCADPDQRTVVVDSLQRTADADGLPFDPGLLHFVPWDTDTYWTRDYGPWWVKNTHTGNLGIAKHLYTTMGGGRVGLVEGAWTNPTVGAGIFRPNDDYGADRFSDFLNAPVRVWNGASWSDGAKTLPPLPAHDWYFTGLLEVGGNYMVNGAGIVASSYLVAAQNALPTKSDRDPESCAHAIEERMQYILGQLNRFMGIHTYHVLTDPSGTYIGHIDCWGKFLAADKVLIARSEDAKVNAAYDHIAGSFVKEGFQVYRVLCQDIFVPNAVAPASPATTAAYTNSLMLNDHVYVPIVGGKDREHDESALDVYRKALPGYTIVGIHGKAENPWYGTDALHCRTMGVPREAVDVWLKSQALPAS